MEIGVFIPIGNNGWLISTTSPQYKPSFELNKEIVRRAERYGLDFALSMIKLRGFGGDLEFWDYNLESFTLMAGLAAVTQRIKLFASVAVLTIPPAIIARMAVTIDSIAPGRFGINIVSGWHAAEYTQMGVWPGEHYFAERYDYSTEYVRIMKELWDTGRSDFAGKYFTMEDCRLGPTPSATDRNRQCRPKRSRHALHRRARKLCLLPWFRREHADRARVHQSTVDRCRSACRTRCRDLRADDGHRR